MSAVIERFLLCDGEQCDINYGVDNRHESISEHRRSAKSEGWTYSKGKDYCPKCSNSTKQKTKP